MLRAVYWQNTTQAILLAGPEAIKQTRRKHGGRDTMLNGANVYQPSAASVILFLWLLINVFVTLLILSE